VILHRPIIVRPLGFSISGAGPGHARSSTRICLDTWFWFGV